MQEGSPATPVTSGRDRTSGQGAGPQGDTREHLAALDEAGAEVLTVRRRRELDSVDGLVIPGGSRRP